VEQKINKIKMKKQTELMKKIEAIYLYNAELGYFDKLINYGKIDRHEFLSKLIELYEKDNDEKVRLNYKKTCFFITEDVFYKCLEKMYKKVKQI
jgi:chromosome segregation and condensation protein ScpB